MIIPVRIPVRHQYVCFPEDGGPRWDLVQMPPSVYERVARYLAPHFTVTSTATQRLVENLLRSHGVVLLKDDNDESPVDEHRYPELVDLAKDLNLGLEVTL